MNEVVSARLMATEGGFRGQYDRIQIYVNESTRVEYCSNGIDLAEIRCVGCMKHEHRSTVPQMTDRPRCPRTVKPSISSRRVRVGLAAEISG